MGAPVQIQPLLIASAETSGRLYRVSLDRDLADRIGAVGECAPVTVDELHVHAPHRLADGARPVLVRAWGEAQCGGGLREPASLTSGPREAMMLRVGNFTLTHLFRPKVRPEDDGRDAGATSGWSGYTSIGRRPARSGALRMSHVFRLVPQESQ